MKKIILTAALSLAATQTQAGWLDWLSNDSEEANTTQSAEVNETVAPAPAVNNKTSNTATALSLLPMLTSQLGVTESQASGGTGALLQVAQGSLNAGQFSSLSQYIPDTDVLLAAAPAITGQSNSTVGGLLSMAGEYNDTARVMSQVSSQFEALGLDPAMIGQYITVTQSFLQSSSGQTAVDLFSKSMAGLL